MEGEREADQRQSGKELLNTTQLGTIQKAGCEKWTKLLIALEVATRCTGHLLVGPVFLILDPPPPPPSERLGKDFWGSADQEIDWFH